MADEEFDGVRLKVRSAFLSSIMLRHPGSQNCGVVRIENSLGRTSMHTIKGILLRRAKSTYIRYEDIRDTSGVVHAHACVGACINGVALRRCRRRRQRRVRTKTTNTNQE